MKGVRNLLHSAESTLRGRSSSLLRWQECQQFVPFQNRDLAQHGYAAAIWEGKVAYLL